MGDSNGILERGAAALPQVGALVGDGDGISEEET